MKSLYGREAIAEYLKVSRMTVYRWDKVNPLPRSTECWGDYNIKLTTKEADEWSSKNRRYRRYSWSCRNDT